MTRTEFAAAARNVTLDVLNGIGAAFEAVVSWIGRVTLLSRLDAVALRSRAQHLDELAASMTKQGTMGAQVQQLQASAERCRAAAERCRAAADQIWPRRR